MLDRKQNERRIITRNVMAVVVSLLMVKAVLAGQVFEPNKSGTANGTIDSCMKVSSVPFTFEAWVRPSDTVSENHIFGLYLGGSANDIVFSIHNKKARVFVRNYNTDGTTLYSRQNISESRWSHVAMTCDMMNIKVYVDGVLGGVLPFSKSGEWRPADINLCLAGIKAGTSFRGMVCDMRYWTVVRSEEEIARDMGRRLSGGEIGLAGCWPMTETSGMMVANIVAGMPQGVCAGGGWTSMDDHPFPPADYHFIVNDDFVFQPSGITSILDTRLLPDATKPFTFEAWVCPSDVQREGVVLAMYGGGGGSVGDIMLRFSGGRARFWMRGNAQQYEVVGATPLEAGKWRHLAVTYDFETIRLYLDGELDGTVELPDNLAIAEYNQLIIGGLKLDKSPFEGPIREIQYWSVVRSAEQICVDMRERPLGDEMGLIGYWPLNESMGTYARNLGASGVAACNIAASFVELKTNPYHTYKLSDKVYNSASGKGAIDSGMRIRTSNFTLEAWVKAADIVGENIIMSQYIGSGTLGDLVFKLDGGRPWLFLRYFGNLGTVSGIPLPVGKWVHVATTCDGQVVKIYVNGELTKTITRATTSAEGLPANSPLILSGLNESNCFRGQMSDVRFWNVVQTGEEIASDYQRRLIGKEIGLVGYWPMDGGNANYVESIAYPRIFQSAIVGEWGGDILSVSI